MKLEIIILSRISKPQRDKYCVISLILSKNDGPIEVKSNYMVIRSKKRSREGVTGNVTE